MSPEAESLILELLRDMRAEVGEIRAEMTGGFVGVRSEVHALRAGIAADLAAFEARQVQEHRQTREEIADLLQLVGKCHASIVDQGRHRNRLHVTGRS